MSVVADTHAMIWYLDAPQNLSMAATAALDKAAENPGEHILISAITLVEMRYLVEKNRIRAAVWGRVEQELDVPDPRIVVVSLDRTISDALLSIPRDAAPDMPDRIIAATAFAMGLPLVTRDSDLRVLTNLRVVW